MDANATRQASDIEIRPQAGPQELYLSTPADIAVYGGSAGGGKTWSLLLDPIRDVDVAGFTALILRRTYKEITLPGALWDESTKLYPYAGGKPTEGDLRWRFASGARIDFGHLQYEKHLSMYDGAQIAYIAFDQLEHFTEKMFWYLQIRNRSNCGVPGRLRASCNPDPDSFLITGPEGWGSGLLGWWIDEDGYAIPERAGILRWFVRYQERLHWGDTREELLERFRGVEDAPDPVSFTFIPATIYDNKILLANDPTYIAKLKNLPRIERERFLGDAVKGGNWKVRPEAGKVFDRTWFEVVEEAPVGGIDCRGWDFAASLAEVKGDDPDFTASVKIRLAPDGYLYVLDMTEERMVEIDEYVKSITQQDLVTARQAGARYRCRWGKDPGAAGVRESARLNRLLSFCGNAEGLPEIGDKLTKWKPLRSTAEAGKVRVVAAPWTDRFLAHLHGQPDLAHDDVTDAAQKAHDGLAGAVPVPKPLPPNPWKGRKNL